MGETHDEGENGHPFFWCINTAWLTKQTSAMQNTFIVGTRPGRAQGTMIATFSQENKGKVTAGNSKKEYDPLPGGKLCVGKDVHQVELK